MILNSETDYAIRIVACLSESNTKLDAKTIADKTGVTQRYSLKILHKLTQSGIVKSFMGAKGGYMLAKSPESITLLEVIEIMCGPISFSRCQGTDEACTHPQGVCYFRNTFDDVRQYMQEKFSSVNFSKKV